jgi:selenocysteine lyase/cysteine desulfurase
VSVLQERDLDDADLDVAGIRAQLPGLSDVVYLNTGTAGIAARPVVERLIEEITLFEERGEVVYQTMQDRMETARARLAAFVGAGADEVAFTRNATDGVNLVAWGLPWQAGDEVILSDEEHPAMILPWHHLRSSGGPRVRTFRIEPDPEATLENVRALITPRTRLIASSHVSCVSGTRVPARELCALASDRGALSLLDGAQAVGQFPVDVAALGCDFYVGNGHKWLHGPKGTGFLYVRHNRLDELAATHVGAGAFERPLDLDDLRPVRSARRYEYATRSYGTYAALSAALDWLDGLGWDRLERRLARLSRYLKEQVRDVPGLTLVSPQAWERSSALVSFSLNGVDSSHIQTFLWEQARVRSRIFPDRPIVRISTAYFNTEAELDVLVGLLRRLTA